jgi:uncharacterized DUF497 family protein
MQLTGAAPATAANATKHGVSFEEAQWVFYDEHALVLMTLTIPKVRTASSSSGSAARCVFSWSSTASLRMRRFASSAPVRRTRRSRGSTWSA